MAKTCFIISSIGKEGSEIRAKADEKYELIFEPILKELGYHVTRADKIASPSSISREIVDQVINSTLVIADVSDENPNVFYELAIRNAVKKSVIVFKGIEQTMPFDIYDKRAISIDRAQPRVWENAKKALKNQVIESEKNSKLASESILSDYDFKINTEEARSEPDKVYSLLKDLQDDVRRIAQKPTLELFQSNPRKPQVSKQYQYIIIIPQGSSVPGCEATGECYIPSSLEIKQGDTVLWLNEDSAAHTVTSGCPTDGPNGSFDSSLFMSGNSFTHKFDFPGEFHYFCMVHPWQKGKILVK